MENMYDKAGFAQRYSVARILSEAAGEALL